MKSNMWLSALLLTAAAGSATSASAQSLKDMQDKAKQAGQQAVQDVKKAAQSAADKAMGKDASKAAADLDLSAPLPTDPRLLQGVLDNGMSYIVVKHSNPPGRANMYIHVSSGSLNEKDNQRGIAHFLEHMAFNGSENFKPGSVVDFFQSMGLTFGQHQNAFTSFDQTAYILSFPDAKAETLEKGMRFFSDVAGKLLLTQEEIDEERQVIMEEKRTRLGAAQRVQEYMLERMIPGSLIGQRLPIGVEETLKSMNRADFLDYYTRWYQPSNMTVIIVADADPSQIAAQITKTFSGGERTPRPVDVDPMVKPFDTTRAIVASDPELTSAEVGILSVKGKEAPITTVGDFRREAVRDLGVSAFNRRLGAKLAKGGMAMTGGSAGATNLFNAASLRQVSAEGEPGKWKDVLGEIATELQRARMHGFTQREIDDVKTQITSRAERFVEQEKTIPAPMLIRGINGAVASGDTPMGAQQELDLYSKVLPTVTAAEVSREFAELFDVKHVTFTAELPSNTPGGVPSDEQLLAIGKEALSVSPSADAEASRPTTLLSTLPTPGKVVDTSEHSASGVTTMWLDNGALVHYRFMDIRKDNAWVSVTLAAGQIEENASNRGMTDVAGLAWANPATSTLSSTDIRDLMTGKKVGVGGGVGTDTLTLSVSGNPNELEVGMQQAYLMLTDPKIEQSAFDRWKVGTLQSIEQRKSTPQAAMVEAMMKTMYPPSEARVQVLTADQVNTLSVSASQEWLTGVIKTAPIEVSIVGDISKEKAVELATRYVGSLPKRERISGQTLDHLRTIKKVQGPIVTRLELETKTPLAVVLNGFYGPDAENVTDTRTMLMASRVLSTRILKKIREEEQLSYSPGARLQPGEVYPGFGAMMLFSPTEPAKVDRLLAASTEIFTEFAQSGPTIEELDVAKKQLANQLDETMKQPDFWLQRTATMTYRNVNLDDVLGANDFYQKLTPADVKGVFAKYYKPESVMQVIVKPAISAAAPEQGDGAEKSGKPMGG